MKQTQSRKDTKITSRCAVPDTQIPVRGTRYPVLVVFLLVLFIVGPCPAIAQNDSELEIVSGETLVFDGEDLKIVAIDSDDERDGKIDSIFIISTRSSETSSGTFAHSETTQRGGETAHRSSGKLAGSYDQASANLDGARFWMIGNQGFRQRLIFRTTSWEGEGGSRSQNTVSARRIIHCTGDTTVTIEDPDLTPILELFRLPGNSEDCTEGESTPAPNLHCRTLCP